MTDVRILDGLAKLEERLGEVEQFIRLMTEGGAPAPDVITEAHHTILNAQASAQGLRHVMERQQGAGRN